MARQYKDPIIDRIIQKLKDEGPSDIKTFYYGDVTLPPRRELPICAVIKNTTTTMPASNTEDDHKMGIVINVLVDYAKDFNNNFDLVAGTTQLYDMVEGRDDNMDLKVGTIMRVLRKYGRLDDNLFLAVGPNEAIEVTYGLGIERRGKGIYSLEAIIRFNARLIKGRDIT